MKKVFFALLTLVLISCNNEKPKVEEKPEVIKENVEVVKLEKFVVEIELKYSEVEEIKLFATDVFINNNRTMSLSIAEKVIKSDDFIKVILDLPENIKPDYQVGLNFGNKTPNLIEMKSINISYGDKEFDISSKNLAEYFTFNKFIDYNSESGTLITKKVDGRLNPLMFFRRKIIDNI